MKRITFVLTVAGCLLMRAHAAVPPVEKLLPDDTLAFFTIPDFAGARNIYSNSPQGRLLQDAALKAFKDKFLGKLKESFTGPLEHDLGIQFDDYASLPQGQLTVAVTQNGFDPKGPDGQTPGLLLLVDTKDQSPRLKAKIAELKKKWVDSGRNVRTEKIRDVDFSVVTLSTNDVPNTLKKAASTTPSGAADAPDAPDAADAKTPRVKSDIYIGQADSLLLMGNSAKTIEKVLAGMAGAEVKTISDLPAYEADQAAMFRDATAFGWVNARLAVDLLKKSFPAPSAGDDPAASPFSLKPEKVLGAIGLAGLKTLALSFAHTSEGMQTRFFVGVPEAGREGLFKILAGESKETSPPAFVPASAVKFQRWRVDGQKAWATIQKALNDINPQAVNTLDFLLSTAEAGAKEKDPAFDIKKSLFGNLGDDIITYAKPPKGNTLAELGSPPSLFLLGSPNGDQLAAAIRSLLPMLGSAAAGGTEREFLGKKVYSFALPSTPAAPGAAPAQKSLNYASGGGYLAVSSDAAILEEFLRSSQAEVKPLRDTPGLADALQKVAGAGSSMAGYSNDSEAMRVALEALKQDLGSATGSLAPLLAMAGLGGDDKFKEWVDVSLLPGYDKIAKYFSFTVYGETATADGINFKSFTPLPPELK